MPVEVTDAHRNEGGQQVTTRTVEVSDAAGNTTTYEFEQAHPIDADEWTNLGDDDDPTDTALDAVRAGPNGGEGDA
jgi:hypothetical protein